MKVFCRFAPLAPQSGAGTHSVAPSSIGRVPGVPLVLRVSAHASDADSEEVLLVDPVTHSHASFVCDGVLVASSLEDTVVYKGDNVMRRREEDRQRFDGDQEALYERLFGHVARSLGTNSTSTPHTHLFLTYGQTSSGKTYTLFGAAPHHTRSAYTAALPPTAGVVPRFFHDIFRACADADSSAPRTTAAFVDLTCMEIYNEVTTDMAALALEEGRMAAQRLPVRRRASQLGRLDSTTGTAAPDVHAVEVATALYCRSHRDDPSQVLEADGLPPFPQVTYKVTEKSKLRRLCLRMRCTSAAECVAVTEQLVALRQSRLTARNARSSRGHLLLRAEVYVASPPGASSPSSAPVLDREVLFVDLAGSESQRDASSVHSSEPASTVSAAAGMGSGGGVGRHLYRRSHSLGSARSLGTISLDSGDGGLPRTNRRGILANNSSFDDFGGSPDSTTFGSTTTLPRHAPRHRRSASLTAAALLNPAAEKVRQEAAIQKRSQELRHINTSLLALRKVVHALHDASRQRRVPSAWLHAPFKDSTLTTVLEPYLMPCLIAAPPHPAATGRGEASGETVVMPDVVFLICCSSQQRDFHETVSSLRLGAEASSVKPAVVLQALPVRRQPAPKAASSHHASRNSSLNSSRVFARSQSAPVQATSGGPVTASQTASVATRVCLPLAPSASNASPALALDAKDREELLRLRQEVQSYKATAMDLYEQCRQLCDNYARAVRELAASKAAHVEKDARIAELNARCDEMQRRCVAAPPAPAAPEPSGVREISVPRQPSEGTSVVVSHAVTPWSAGRDIVISADTTCEKVTVERDNDDEAAEEGAADVVETAAQAESPGPGVREAPLDVRSAASRTEEGTASIDAFREAILQALRTRHVRSPQLEANEDASTMAVVSSNQTRELTAPVSTPLSASDPNCVPARTAKTCVRHTADVAGDEVPRAPPLHIFRS